MCDLADLDCNNDVIGDLCAGTGVFSLLAYKKIKDNIDEKSNNKKISNDDRMSLEEKLKDMFVINDSNNHMLVLSFASFILRNINLDKFYCADMCKTDLSTSYFGTEINKIILNPPYEEKFKPVEIIKNCYQIIYRTISDNKEKGIEKKGKLVVIIPSGVFSSKEGSKNLVDILLHSKLTTIIKTQPNLFIESNVSVSANVFIFEIGESHKKEDKIYYYDFSDSGYEYYKDSGLVDKYKKHERLKKELLEKIKNHKIDSQQQEINFSNFYDVNDFISEKEFFFYLDPDQMKEDPKKADLSIERIKTDKNIAKKEQLIKQTNNHFVDDNKEFEKHLIDILSEDYE